MLCPGASRLESEDRMKPIHGPVLNIDQTETALVYLNIINGSTNFIEGGAEKKKWGKKKR